MRALTCVRACVRTCACDLSFKRGASGTNLKTSTCRARRNRNPCLLAHDIDTQPIKDIHSDYWNVLAISLITVGGGHKNLGGATGTLQ